MYISPGLALLQDSDCPEVKGFGSSCSCALVEFENEDVAEMVVEIMNTTIWLTEEKKRKELHGALLTLWQSFGLGRAPFQFAYHFWKDRKSEVVEMNDDKDNGIIFKQPVSIVKERIQKALTPIHSWKQRQEKKA
ncbi:hypothetical protein A6R68_07139, partial [Neotoma lepida]